MNRYKKYFRSILLPVAIVSIFSQAVPVQAQVIELSLEDSIKLAYKNNPAMKIVEASKEKSAWAVKQAQAGGGMTVNYTHTDLYSTAPPSFVASLSPVDPYTYFTNKVAVNMPIYTAGKVENSIDQAKLGLQVADLNIKATKQQLKLTTTTAYFKVLQSCNLLAIAKQGVDDFTAHLGTVQDMYQQGVIAYPDVLQTKVRLANAENNLVKAQNNYDLTLYNLNDLIGLPLDSEIVLGEKLTYEKSPLSIEEGIQYALVHRPEMAGAKVTIDMAKDQIKMAQSDKKPVVNLTATTAWDDTDFAGINNNNWTMMLSAQFNLFDSGRTDSLIKQAQSGAKVVEGQAHQTKDAIALEVSRNYLSMKEAEKRIDTNHAVVEEAEVNFDIAKERYHSGIGTNLDIIDAELALAQAKTNYIQGLYDYNTSKAELDKSMGIDTDQ